MCGIIGVKANDIKDLSLARCLLEESQIRGKHSTGVSYITVNGLKTIKDMIPSKEFITKYWSEVEQDIKEYGSVNLVAHTRYSTSGVVDVRNAQPIADNKLSIVLNGVITQSSPDKWLNEFGVECTTTNDTEIAHIKMKSGVNPLRLSKSKDDIRFSMAICALWDNGRIQFFRNGRRPQYHCNINPDLTIVASTKEIIKRAMVKNYGSINMNSVVMTSPGYVLELIPMGVCVKDVLQDVNVEDWQL